MNYHDYVELMGGDIEKALIRLSAEDPSEQSIREKYPAARYRAPHPIFDLVQSLTACGLLSGAEEVRLIPIASEIDCFLRREDNVQKLFSFPKTLQTPITERLKDSASLNVDDCNSPQNGHIDVLWESESYIMPLTFTPSEHGEAIAFHFVPKAD